ncbi:hypothetical protein ASF22_22400 [Methylobacterium sp. Leaf87]|nr:hypothetical protein ASF22_22400 [Methylobacterium sp. Leaf87]
MSSALPHTAYGTGADGDRHTSGDVDTAIASCVSGISSGGGGLGALGDGGAQFSSFLASLSK